MAVAAVSVGLDERTIVITRQFDAPRELVFEAWTKPSHLAHWFGPKAFTAPTIEADVRRGGAWRVCIRAPEGVDYWMHGIYRAVEPPSRLVFTHIWEDGHDAAGHETLVTVTFDEIGGGTRMTFNKAILVSATERASQRSGWSECFDRLGDYIAGLRSAGSRP